MKRVKCAVLAGFLFLSAVSGQAASDAIRVGSKTFTESYVLAEILSQAIEHAGEARVERKLGLGSTAILYQSMLGGAVDLSPADDLLIRV